MYTLPHRVIIVLLVLLVAAVRLQRLGSVCEVPSAARTTTPTTLSPQRGRCTGLTECAAIIRWISPMRSPLPTHVSDYLNTLHAECSGFTGVWPNICCLDEEQHIPKPNINNTEGNNPAATTILDPRSEPDLGGVVVVVDPASSNTNNSAGGEHRSIRLLPLDDCGPIDVEKISLGNATSLFEYPWMVLLRYDDGSGALASRCGGSLISDRYVLTAAHCIRTAGAQLVQVRLGDWDTASDVDCETVDGTRVCAEPVQDIGIEEMFAHEMYNKPRYANDIGLIRLARRANINSDSVRPVCLPVTVDIQKQTAARVIIAGWGNTENNTLATKLLQATLPVVSNADCERAFGGLIRLSVSHMCAGGELGVDACGGDSGGPLVYPAQVRSTQMVQFGVVSLGRLRCSNETITPGIYTRVADFMPWLLDRMRD